MPREFSAHCGKSANRIAAQRHVGRPPKALLLHADGFMPSNTRHALGWNTWILLLLVIVMMLLAWGFYLAE